MMTNLSISPGPASLVHRSRNTIVLVVFCHIGQPDIDVSLFNSMYSPVSMGSQFPLTDLDSAVLLVYPVSHTQLLLLTCLVRECDVFARNREHCEHGAEPGISLYVDRGHAVQFNHPGPVYPAGQLVHTEDLVVEYLPISQSMHAEARAAEYFPATQLMQAEAEAREYSPTVQFKQTEASDDEYLPAAQSKQTEEVSDEYFPAKQP